MSAFAEPPLPSSRRNARCRRRSNGDGDPDLLINTPVRLLRNQGSGFVDVSATHVPPGRNVDAFAVADFDGDGDLDVYGAYGYGNCLLRNGGNGVFADVTPTCLPPGFASGWAAAAVDIDGDGDLDVVDGRRLLRNSGSGVIVAGPDLLPRDQGDVLAIAAGDLDHDGDADLVIGTRWLSDGYDHLLLGDGAGGFADLSPNRLEPSTLVTTHLVAGDFDGDGDVDLIGLGETERWWRNDGSGWFTDVAASLLPHLTSPGQAVECLLSLDADGDGDLDLVVTRAAHDLLLINDGSGRFQRAPAGALSDASAPLTAIASGDLDGDGDVDLIYGVSLHSPIVLENRGGSFRWSLGILPSFVWGTPASLAVGDVDGDGDLDIVAGYESTRNRLYLNRGNGFFVDATTNLPPDQDDTTGVVLGDFDGDGDLDLFCANSWSSSTNSAQDRLYRNDGHGVFTDVTSSALPIDMHAATGAAATDFDADGDLDLLLVGPCFGCVGQRLYRNDGTGHFVDTTARNWPQAAAAFGLVMADIDGDGDRDAVLRDGFAPRVHFNCTRQLHAPWPARVGRTFELEVEQHDVAGPSAALVMLATVRTPGVATPFGTLGIAPLVALPPIAMAPHRVALAQFPLPAQPALVGLAFYAQALLVAPARTRLTNVTSTVVLP